MKKSIVVENLSKRYGLQSWALKDISFSIEPGQIVGLIGNRGSGKSTLLKILARIVSPTSGQATIAGRITSVLDPGTEIDRKLTGRENILLLAAFRGLSQRKILQRLPEIIAFANLKIDLDLPVGRYSLDTYLRFAWSLAICLEPNILLIDDILTTGSQEFQDFCDRYIQKASLSGLTVLYVSQNFKKVEDLCHSCICLDQGRLFEIGNPQEIITRYSKYTLEHPAIINNSVQNKPANNTQGLVNEYGKITSVEITSVGSQDTEKITTLDDALIEINFEIFIKSTVLFKIDLFTQGIHFLHTVLPPEKIKEYLPGSYNAGVYIPRYLWGERKYSVDVYIVINTKKSRQGKLFWKNALSFQVYSHKKKSNFASQEKNKEKDWLVHSLLEWKIIENNIAPLEE